MQWENTALKWAAKHGHGAATLALIRAGADLNITDKVSQYE